MLAAVAAAAGRTVVIAAVAVATAGRTVVMASTVAAAVVIAAAGAASYRRKISRRITRTHGRIPLILSYGRFISYAKHRGRVLFYGIAVVGVPINCVKEP